MILSKLFAVGKQWAAHAILALILSTFILLAWFSYRSIDQELTDSALARRSTISYLAATTLSEKFDRLLDIGIALATRVRFRELIEAGNWAEAIKILGNVPADFPFIERIALTDVRGTSMADVPEILDVRGLNFAYRDWYQAVMRDGKPYISQVFLRTAPPRINIFVAAIPIKSRVGAMLGIMVVQVRSDTFFEWTKNIDVGPQGLIYVVDRRGMLVAHPKFPQQGDPIDYSGRSVVQRVLRGNHGVEIAFNPIENEKLVVAYEPIAKHGWGIVLEQPVATVFAARNGQLKVVLIAYGVILIFMVFTAYLVSRIVSQRKQADQNLRARAELEQRAEERSRAEAALRESNALLNAMFESAPDGILLVGADGRIARANGEAVRMFGYGSEEITGKPIDDLIPRRYRENHVRHRLGYVAHPHLRAMGSSMELYALRSDGGEFPVDITLGPLRTDGSMTVICIVRDITERKHAQQALRNYADQLRQLSRRMFEVEESERRRLARELHDRIGQNVTALSLNLNLVRSELPADVLQKISARLSDCESLLYYTAQLVRDVMVDLRPPGLDEFGLLVALNEHARQVAGRSSSKIIVVGTEILPRLAPAMEITLFRIVQEALNNISKHAQASEVTITVNANPEEVIVTIADNGRGFDPAARPAQPTHSLGMVSMRERADSMGGTLRIESAPGQGTRVIVEAPRVAVGAK